MSDDVREQLRRLLHNLPICEHWIYGTCAACEADALMPLIAEAEERGAARVRERVEALALTLWDEGDKATRRRSYPEGVAKRNAANRIRAVLRAAP